MRRHVKLSAKGYIRLAHLTRRWDRHKNPIGNHVGRLLLKAFCSARKPRPSLPLVMPYDAGFINLNLATEIGYKIMFHGYHDPSMARVLRHVTRPGSACIDLGANIGAYTLIMAFAAGPAGSVIAVEPHPEIAAELSKNLALNRLDNVTVINAALTQEDGETALFSRARDATNRLASSLRPSGGAGERTIPVKTISARVLESALENRSCDVIKIDVNGAEMIVLRELGEMISRRRPCLLVEHRKPFWDAFGARIEDAINLLHKWGYDLYSITKGVTRPLGKEAPEKCNLLCVPSFNSVEIPAGRG